MSNYAVMPYADYESACNAIRSKTGKAGLIKSGDLSAEINNIAGNIDLSKITTVESEVLRDETFVKADGSLAKGTMPNRGAVSLSISYVNSTPIITEGYHNGGGRVSISEGEKAKILPENIAEDTSILGIQGVLKKVTSKSGIVSLKNGNIEINGLSEFLTIEKVFISNTEQKPAGEVLNVFSIQNLNLTTGGSVLLSALCGEENTYDGYDLKLIDVTCTFDGETLTILKPSDYSFIANSTYTILR